MKLVIALGLIMLRPLSVHNDVACIGFTGPQCDRTYQATAHGLHCAIYDTPPNAGVTIWVAPVTITLHSYQEFCSDTEERGWLNNANNWLPWNLDKYPLRLGESRSLTSIHITPVRAAFELGLY